MKRQALSFPVLAGAVFSAQLAEAAERPKKKATVDVSGVGVNFSPDMGSAYTGPKAFARLVEVARCVVERARGASEKLLQTTPESSAEASIKWGPISGRLDQCSHMYMGATGVVLRGAIAQVLYEERFAAASPAAAAPAASPVPRHDWPRKGEAAAQLATIYDFAGCVVAANSGLVRRLVLSPPASDAETAALRALRPHLAPCLVKGVTFNTNRETLRAVLTETLYRWSLAQPAAAAPGGGVA